MGKSFTRALRHLKSNHKTTKLDEKKEMLNEIPTMNMSGVYSKNPPGFRYDPPSPAKRFIPDVDGNWPAGVPGTPGASEYIRPQGYWVNDSDWETKFAPNMSNDSILESPTNTDGFIDAQSGTVKTLLPPNSRSFILGPLVDGYNYNHGYDDFTRIGYIQKDTRQFVLLGIIQGHWNTNQQPDGRTPRLWDGTSSQFTAYNSNFTLAMAQWFKDRMTANDFTKNFPYFYSGGVFQGPLPNQPPGSPGGMNGGNAAGTGGGGNDPGDGDGKAAVGSGGTPDIGTEQPQGDTEGGNPGDLNLWGLFKKGVDTAKGVYSKITGSRLGQYGAMIAAKSTIGIMDNIVYGGSKYLLKGVGAGRKFNPKFTGAGPSTGTIGKIFRGKKLVDWGDSLINGSINRISKSIGGPANFAPNLIQKIVGKNYAGQWFTDPTRVNVATGYARKLGPGGTATLIPRTAGKFGWKNWLGSNTSRSLAMQPETFQRTEDILNVMEGATKTLRGFGKDAKKIGGARLNLDIDNPKTQKLLRRYAAKVATNSKTLKTIARGIPFLGAGISMADAAHRFSQGDWKGGALSIASMVPGPVGWFALGAQVSVDTGALEKGIEFAYNRQTGFNPDTGMFEPRTNQDWDARRAARGGGDRNEYGQNIKVTPGAPAKPIGNAETSKIDLEIANIKVELSKPSTKDYEKNRLNQRLNRARQRLETAYNKLDSDHERNVQDWEARRSARGSSYKPPSSNTGNTGQLPGDTAPGADVPAENTSREVNGIIEYNRGLKTDPNGREYYEILRYPKGGSLYSPRAYTFKSYIDDGTTQKDSDDPGMPSNPDFRGPGNNKDFKPEDKPKPFDWWKGGGSDEPEPEKDYERNRRRNRPRTQFNDYMLDGDFLLEEKQEQYMNANMGELQDEMRKAGIPIDDPQEMADQFGLASLAAGMNPEIVEIIQLAIINAPLTPQQQEDISKAMLDFASVIYANEKAEQIYGKNTNELADKDDEGLDEQIEIIINEDKKIEEREEKKRILREITQPLKEIKELPKTQKLEKYRPNFAGKYKPQNTPNVTASKKSDEMVKAKNAAGQTWRTKDKYWGGYESQERMNVVYDNVGHGNQYFDKIVSENLSKKNIKNRQVQEHLNIIAHEKAMRQLDSSFVSPFKSIEEQETYDNKVKDPLFSKVSDRLNKEINYEKKPSPKGYPNEAPPKMDPDTGMHPKYGKRYKYDKLDPQSAEAMPVQGNPEIDANVQKALDKRAKDRKIKNLTVNTTNEKVDWRETLQKRNVGESKKDFKNLRKDLQEQLYTNITTGMKVGQTLRHIPSGQTFTTGGALGGTETLPSTFSIFGDPTPAPDVTDVSSYPLQGYAKPMDMMRRKNREDLEDINARLDASQEFAQKVNSDVMMNARVSQTIDPIEYKAFQDKMKAFEDDQAKQEAKYLANLVSNPLEFSNKIQAMDADYAKRQARIQVLKDKQEKVYDKYKPQYDALNKRIDKIQSKYFNQDTMRTDDAIDNDPEYKSLLNQMQKLSDAQKAENDPLQAEVNSLSSSSEFDYQVPGSKEYKDMQRVSFDEYRNSLYDQDYNKVLMGFPEERWKLMHLWAAQNKRAMNFSRIRGLKDLLDPATGKVYSVFNPTGTKAGYYDSSMDTQLGEFVKEKLKTVGQIHHDHNQLGSSMKHSDLEFMVLTKGAPALEVYAQELSGFEKYMSEVNNILEKDLKEYKSILRKEYKTSSEIRELTHKQAENLKYYQDKLKDIKDHKSRISRIIPEIRKAFEGNFESTPTPIIQYGPPIGPFDGDDMPSGEGTFDKDGNYYPPGFEDAIRTDQINNLDNKQIETAVKDVGSSWGPNIGTGFRIFGDFLTKGHNERFVADRKYLGKEYMNRQFFPNVSFDEDGTYVNKDVVVGSGQPPKYNEETGMIEIRATFDFKKNAHEVESAIASEKDAKADWAGRFSRTGSEYALDATVDPLPGVLKPLSGIVASHLISTAKMFGKGKSIPIVIKITPAELKKKNKKAYKELVELGVISKDK